MGADKKVTGPVNVLAVIDAVISELRTTGDTGHVQNLMDAHAAVAALIEASRVLLDEWDRHDNGMFDIMPAKDWAAAEARFRAASANVGRAP